MIITIFYFLTITGQYYLLLSDLRGYHSQILYYRRGFRGHEKLVF